MFVDDIPASDAHFVSIIRSQAAKGKLKSITCPGLAPPYRLIQAADIPGENALFDAGLPLLAADKVGYRGEPVALLVGPELIELEELTQKCVVEIEEEPPVFSIEDAYDADAFFARKEREGGYPPKVKGELVVEGHYETGIQEHWYSEPHGALARITEDGSLAVTTASQRPGELRAAVAKILGIDEEKVLVENAQLGIHLDGKIWYPTFVASLASLAAFLAKTPVKLQLTREEDYLFSPKRTPAVIHIRSLLTFDGQILETDVLAKIGFGAAGVLADAILENVTGAFMNVYKTGKLTIEALAIQTNHPPTGPFAGFGSSLSSFALERHFTKITDILGEDGVEWRRSHFLGKLRGRFGDIERENGRAGDILTSVSQEAGFNRKWAAYELLRRRIEKEPERVLPQRGIGFSFAIGDGEGAAAETAAPPAAACVIEIEIDRVNYEAKIRGIWLHISCAKTPDMRKTELRLRRAVLASLGWTSTEKIKFIEGNITPPLCALYEIVPVSATPPIHISFSPEEADFDGSDEKLEELPFKTIPAAYTQAISQAVNHHFERIPITGQDVWRVINIKKMESLEKKSTEASETRAGNGAADAKTEEAE